MSDSAKHELMVVVERAVRPVRASVYHKRRMREELLEHLSAVFDSEMELQSDISTGLELAKRRFGDPVKLTEELQQAVPWWDRLRSLGESMNLHPGEPMSHFFAKCVTFALAICVVTLLVALPAMMAGGKAGDIGIALHVVLAMGIFIAFGSFLFIFVLARIGLALYGDEGRRSKWTAARCMLATLFVFPVLFFAFYLAMSGDIWQSLARLPLACYLSPAFTLLLLPMSRQWFDDIRHELEWASLEVEDVEM